MQLVCPGSVWYWPAGQETHAVSGFMSESIVPGAQIVHTRSLVGVGATDWYEPITQMEEYAAQTRFDVNVGGALWN